MNPSRLFLRPSLARCVRRCTTTTTTTARRLTTTGTAKPIKAVFLNASRLDYDNKLDWSGLQAICDLTLNPTDYVHDKATMLDLVQDDDIVITKEMQVPADFFADFPDSVRLLCEAGTGYNNLPIQQARARNIPVCNIPTYSTEAVAHM